MNNPGVKYGLWSLGLMILLGVFILTWWPDNKLHVVACDVGQGDATLLTHNFDQVLIDGGPNNGRVLDCLGENLPFWDRKIELMVMTHPQMDHMGGLLGVIEEYEVGRLIVPGVVNDIDYFWQFRNEVMDREILVMVLEKGDEFRLGDMMFKVLNPEGNMGTELVWNESVTDKDKVMGVAVMRDVNQASVVLKLKYGEFDAWFTGDMTKNEERKLLDLGLISDTDYLKVGHHGSKTSSSEEFIKTLDPEIAVIEVGKNRYGHPNAEVLERLELIEADVYRTDKDGEVEVLSDGSSFWVK